MNRPERVAAIVVAAGTGSRAADLTDPLPKQYRNIGGISVLRRTIEALLAVDRVDLVLPVIHPDHSHFYAALGLSDPRLLPPVHGGESRQASVRAGLLAIEPHAPEFVLIQDAARPFIDEPLVAAVIDALETHDGALPVIPVTDTIKRSADGRTVAATEDRRTLYAAQTPQGFRFAAIAQAHARAAAESVEFTDDAAIAEWAGLTVAMTPGSHRNIKITHAEDFVRAERLLGGEKPLETRIGTGFDVHPFEPGQFVTLGGIRIPHDYKLQGHSDADAALHALTDALYGALGEGDIGTHFPPSDPQWKGADSALFLRHAVGLVAARAGRIVNLDLTIVAERPRIGPHVAKMREKIAEICGISVGRVAVKATTSERLGFTGREEGLVALATASIELPRED